MPNPGFFNAYKNLRFNFLANLVSLLRRHYLIQIDDLGSKLLTLNCSNSALQEAMGLATKLAKARLGKKLKHSTILTWQTIIQKFAKNKNIKISQH